MNSGAFQVPRPRETKSFRQADRDKSRRMATTQMTPPLAVLDSERASMALTRGRSRVRDMTMRAGAWPPSRRVVSRGSSRRTVCPPTTTASDRARQSNTRCRDTAELTQAACPTDVAILPSRVIAYFRTPSGFPMMARCSSACRTNWICQLSFCTPLADGPQVHQCAAHRVAQLGQRPYVTQPRRSNENFVHRHCREMQPVSKQ